MKTILLKTVSENALALLLAIFLVPVMMFLRDTIDFSLEPFMSRITPRSWGELIGVLFGVGFWMGVGGYVQYKTGQSVNARSIIRSWGWLSGIQLLFWAVMAPNGAELGIENRFYDSGGMAFVTATDNALYFIGFILRDAATRSN
ncbi:hypothetical protein [Algiphilus sp.]|uniref:hypothetical protein n=1 Tax=Algiphilus sp. TaxID=1872431 RepID=UPI0025BEE2DB|nr:hypothetical protein [Algiphilus sp.]MCK5771673.1 hypothetical protein [Algiphilus sp.]